MRSSNPAMLQLCEARPMREAKTDEERLQLLELALSLQQWSARNLVCRQALDRAAEDLIALARRTEGFSTPSGSASPPPAEGET